MPDQGCTRFTIYMPKKAGALKLWHANLRNILEVKSLSTFWSTLPDGSDGERLPGGWQKRNSQPGFS